MSDGGSLKVIDLFHGPGGFSDGFIKAGYKIVLAIDNKNSAYKTYMKNKLSENVIKEDIRNLEIKDNKDNYLIKSKSNSINIVKISKDIDVIIGGIPCKPFSPANRSKKCGEKHEAYELYKEFVKFVKSIRPKMFVIENVPRFLNAEGYIDNNENSQKKKIIEIMKAELDQYYITYSKLDFSKYGLPQKRERVIIIGSLNKEVILNLEEQDSITVKEAIYDLPKSCGGNMEYNFLTRYQCERLGLKRELKNHLTRSNNEDVKKRFKHIPQGGNWRNVPDELWKTLKKKFSNNHRRLCEDKPSITIEHCANNYILHPEYHRVISVREAARLQGFDDDFIFCDCLNEQYQLVGDALSPIISKQIAEFIKPNLLS